MKSRGILFVFLVLLSFGMVSAVSTCGLGVKLINQDPYPAVPGDYVKLVFQIDGLLSSANCGDITLNLIPDYPISLNPGESAVRTFKKVDYIKDYKTSILVPYKVRVGKDALDGKTPIEVMVQSKGDAPFSKTFNLSVKDVRAKFVVYVKNYDYATDEITLEILNIGSSKVEAVSVQIPKQEGIGVKGSNKMIVGDLDSNEYSSASFETHFKNNTKFNIDIGYSDAINVRRTVEKTITFDSSYFTNRKADEKKTGVWTYVLWFLVVGLLGYWGYKKIKNKK